MIRDALHAYAAKTERTWAHDRTKTVGASEIGLCARRVWFSKGGTPADEGHTDSWGYTRRGAVYEDAWFVPALRAHYGKRLRYAGDAQKSFIGSPLSATPDGLLRDVTPAECAEWKVGPTDCVLVECKNIGSYKLALAPKPEHEFQVQVQMGLVRAAGRYRPTAAILVYTSAFNWAEVAEFVIEFDEAVFAVARARAEAILSANSAAAVSAEGRLSGGNECRFCPYAQPCAAIELTRKQPGAALRASALPADAESPAA